MDDTDILLVATGDSEAFERIVNRNWNAVAGFFRKHRRGFGDAHDLTQEVFIRVLTKAKSFSPQSFRAWLYRIANNILTDEWRRTRRTTVMEHEPMDFDNDPAKIVELRDEVEFVTRRFKDLPESQTEAIEDFCFGYSIPEIARSQGVCLPTAKSRVRLARAAVLSAVRN